MPDYLLGHSADELHRLTTQAQFLRPITTRMLRSAGLREGMRVLDVGCGAGDVSLLVADLVGSGGRVVGIDRVAAAVSFASARAASGGIGTVTFRHASEADLDDEEPFDFAIGRYVLPYQPDPATFVRSVARRVRPGGTVAFHEFDATRSEPDGPSVPLFDEVWGHMIRGLGESAASPDAARRLAPIFAEAGLTAARGFCERPVGTAGSDLFFQWVAASYVAVRAGEGADHGLDDAQRLAGDLDAAVGAANGQVVGDDQWCAWATV